MKNKKNALTFIFGFYFILGFSLALIIDADQIQADPVEFTDGYEATTLNEHEGPPPENASNVVADDDTFIMENVENGADCASDSSVNCADLGVDSDTGRKQGQVQVNEDPYENDPYYYY